MDKFSAGIHVLISKGDRYLLLQRNKNDKDDPGCWDLPGGGLHLGEQPFDAAIRETKEEANIDVTMTKILAVWGMPYRDLWSIEIIAEAEYAGGDIVLSDEHHAYQWVGKKEFAAIEPKGEHIKFLIKSWKSDFNR